MSKYKIAFIAPGGRSLFKEALPKHPRVKEIHWTNLYKKNGINILDPKINKVFLGYNEILKDIDSYDIIFKVPTPHHVPGGPYYDPKDHLAQVVMTLDNKKLWDRVVIWDYADTPKISEWEYEKCLVYFCKNWVWHKQERLPKLYPLNFAVLDLYVDMLPIDLYKNRDIDIGYYFGLGRTTGGRGKVMRHILSFDWGRNVFVDVTYTPGQGYPCGHNLYECNYPLLHGNQLGHLNWWYVYMHLLRRTKILFACSGGPYDGFRGGDRREAEAVSSGALVFMDKSTIIPMMPHPFEHGKHLFFFDMESDESILNALELAKSYLAKEKTEKREAIANACWNNAIIHHRSNNYVDYAMEIIEERLNDVG